LWQGGIVKKLSVFWVLIVTLFLLVALPLLADQGRKLRHRQGEIWASCNPNVPSMDIGRTFVDAVGKQYRTGQSCRIKQQKGRWIFRHAKKLEVKPNKR
jgi:hypothetical protein